MKYYTYFPGCSASEGGSRAYGQSAVAAAKALDADLLELEDWNCCGSTPCSSINDLAAICISARNLALAEKRGLDVVTPCSCCYVNLNRVNTFVKQSKKDRAKVDDALAAADLKYNGTIKVRHILDTFVNDIGYEAISAKVKKKLGGLKVAAYYGCQMVRPRLGFDDPENPQTLEKLVQAVGAEAVPFALKARCCGGSLIIPEEALALGLIRKLLDCATTNGADCIVTVCPLCQTNLDAYQRRVNSKFHTHYKLPVLFFTQLVGLALGLDPKDLGLNSQIVSPEKVLASVSKEST